MRKITDRSLLAAAHQDKACTCLNWWVCSDFTRTLDAATDLLHVPSVKQVKDVVKETKAVVKEKVELWPACQQVAVIYFRIVAPDLTSAARRFCTPWAAEALTPPRHMTLSQDLASTCNISKRAGSSET